MEKKWAVVSKENPLEYVPESWMTPWEIKMAEIMKKIADKPAPTTTLPSTLPKWTYYGKIDENGFYED